MGRGQFTGTPGRDHGPGGHVDTVVSGPGALFYLRDLRPGDVLSLRAARHTYRYVVRAMRAYAKAVLPAASIFSQHVAARLAIVTCGGPFDAATHHYLDNIIAYAVPVPAAW
ncbi:MAG: class F sortase [Streptosporangiaceae bacterium]